MNKSTAITNFEKTLAEIDFQLRDNYIYLCLVLQHHRENRDAAAYLQSRKDYISAHNGLQLLRKQVLLERLVTTQTAKRVRTLASK